MRSGRSARFSRSVRGTIAAGAAVAALAGAMAGTAEAGALPPGYGAGWDPSALVLSMAYRTPPASGAGVRTATLNCAPAPGGTHPRPAVACAELRSAGGDFTALPSALPYTTCTREWNPVTVTANGVWEGRRVDWSARFNNGCEMVASLGGETVFPL
ncbi:subtilase-type protease inhibitor [Streptomyces sp. CAU 1734]|uniref:subtilase-type protease inhibitor n=1 Tax=Streptomyces sp. CAU 1734 TaxID=3140360 RepID=UPI00326114F0